MYELCENFCGRYVSCIRGKLATGLEDSDDERTSTAAASRPAEPRQTAVAGDDDDDDDVDDVDDDDADLCTSTVDLHDAVSPTVIRVYTVTYCSELSLTRRK